MLELVWLIPALPLAVRGRDVVELLRPLYHALDEGYAPTHPEQDRRTV